MLTIYQVIMILIGVWIAMVIIAIRNKIKYVGVKMGDPMEQGDIWSRRRKKKSSQEEVDSDFDDRSEEELNIARQERGKKMRAFVEKQKKAASKADERQNYLIIGNTREELKKMIPELILKQ